MKDIPEARINIDNQEIVFDLDDNSLPQIIEDSTFSSGNYPYAKKLKRIKYEEELEILQYELVKMQAWLQQSGERIVIVFEGRDTAGKSGTIRVTTQYLNPRHARTIALSKPSDREQGQWYFQRYVSHLPTDGEIVIFDRSWYNRAGVEIVMGFCKPEEREKFLVEAPRFESMLTDEGIHLFKFWLNVGQEMQIKRFHDRRQNPMKSWKLSPIDVKALGKWDDYTKARNIMMDATHTDFAPWTIVRSNDKRRARLNTIRHILSNIDYAGKDAKAIGEIDNQVLGHGAAFFKTARE
ncbi:MAG: polyphosphate kinase 2 [Pseudomonadota bacterium]